MSNYSRIKLAQFILVITTLITLIFYFNPILFLLGLAVSWLFYCLGLSLALHKFSSHRAFEPRNRIIKYMLLWCATVVTMGSTINFAAGHRQHHRSADTPEDPYCLEGDFWHKFRLFFYWFPTYKINPMIIKDLLRDQDHTLFNNHYWKILAVYPLLLLSIDPLWVGYFYAMPVTYVLLGMGYVTVLAHLPSWHRYGTIPNQTGDNSWDSRLFAVLLAGEGYHNTHHAHPGQIKLGPLDTAGTIAGLIRKK